ncbi:hypothetical protein Tco_0297220, partial [Tanacetum coccineum]
FRHSDTERLSRSDEVLKLKNFKKDAPCQAFKNKKGKGSRVIQEQEGQRLKGESSPSPLLVLTCRNQQHLGRVFT